MLVLSRKHKQKIKIGDDIIITVFIKSKYDRVKPNINQISIGIDAPKDIKILRTELINGKKHKKSKALTYFRK
jgi:carbon storage regulator